MNEDRPSTAGVAGRLVGALISGEEIEGLGVLDVGAVVTVDQVAEALGVTKSSATAGVRTLAAKNVIRSRQRTGAVVQPRENWNYLDLELHDWLLDAEELGALEMLHEVRIGVETAAARAAAARILPQQYDAIIGLARKIFTLGYEQSDGFAQHWRDFGEADARYHGLILRASGNPVIHAFEPMITKLLWKRLGRRGGLEDTAGLAFPDVPLPEAMVLHVAQGKAIVQRNADAAEVFTKAILIGFGSGLANPYLQAGLARAFEDLRWSTSERSRYQPLIDQVLLDRRGSRETHARARR
ncbi:FadR/GntR family transcriptional regulator [Actinoplanes regularis]|uniref:FadR/GntR family transcriptional regulator n=1 Tax=Actinoplanes regularis TaxID=52697 RepID=UPI002553607F|nr:FCD domain-containing protein [Actinoplanes regularis]